MSRLCFAIAVVFAFAASPAIAQDKQGDRTKALEAEIAKLRAVQAELEAQLRKAERAQGAREVVDERRKSIEVEIEKALKLKDDQLKRAEVEIEKALKLADDKVKRAQIEGAKTLVLKGAQDKPRVEFTVKDGRDNVPYEKMTPEQLKEVIAKLQKLLVEKLRNAEREAVEKVKPVERVKPGSTDRPDRPDRFDRKPGAASQDEIMKRLDMLAKEIEELKRAIKK
jgi:hypothetical protein